MGRPLAPLIGWLDVQMVINPLASADARTALSQRMLVLDRRLKYPLRALAQVTIDNDGPCIKRTKTTHRAMVGKLYVSPLLYAIHL
jgi:hypothetical protein